MKISAIKQCFADPRVRACIAKDCWEMPLYREALNRYQGDADADAVYGVIRSAFLSRYPSSKIPKEDWLEMKKYRDVLSELSRKLYGKSGCWMAGTPWEAERAEREERKAQRKAALDRAGIYYERLQITPRPKHDLVVFALSRPAIWQQIEEREAAGTPVMTRQEMYDCFENALIPTIRETGVNYVLFRMMSAASFLAWGDSRLWAEKNGLDYEKMEASVYPQKEE